MKPLKETTVAIVGLGLMGGSLALALKESNACARIVAVTPEKAARELAIQMRAVDRASDDLRLVGQADVIILATPVRVIIEQLAAVGEIAKDGAIILDVGSTKERVVAEMGKLPSRLDPIGGHPMCGKEQSGIGAADAELFHGAVFAFTPLARTSPQALALVQELARSVGARPLVLDPARHDRLVAATSHLPFLLAVSLMETATELQGSEHYVLDLAASGFRDTSRLAASDTKMMLDILATNRENILERVREYSSFLERLVGIIQDGDEEVLRSVLNQAAESRRAISPKSRQ